MKEKIHRQVDPDQEVKVLTKDDNNQTINLSENDNFAIRLFSNRTTGFQWEIINIDKAIIEELDPDHQYEPPPTSEDGEPTFGGGGKEVFTFKTISTGETKLSLCYKRVHSPCEINNEFNINIIIE